VYPRAPGRRQLTLRQDDGFTLIEVLTATTIAIVVLLGVFAMVEAVTKSATNDRERGSAVIEQTAAVHNMVQEINEAYAVKGPSSAGTYNYVDIDVWGAAGGSTKARRIVFDCEISSPVSGERECVRYVMPVSDATVYTSLASDANAKPTVVIPRIINGTAGAPVFELKAPHGGSTPTYGEVSIETPSAGERAGNAADNFKYAITLHDSFTLRNLTLGE